MPVLPAWDRIQELDVNLARRSTNRQKLWVEMGACDLEFSMPFWAWKKDALCLLAQWDVAMYKSSVPLWLTSVSVPEVSTVSLLKYSTSFLNFLITFVLARLEWI